MYYYVRAYRILHLPLRPNSLTHGPLAMDALDSRANPSRDSRKHKKSSNSKPTSTGTPEVSSTLSLSNSNERGGKLDQPTKREWVYEETPGSYTESNGRLGHKRDGSGEPDNSDSADLFFVDLSPSAIPSIPVSQESSTTIVESKNIDKLLLPSHVSVFGNTLVEIISQPLSDSDDDEFIKYLDYEDTRVCTQLLLYSLLVHPMFFLRMPRDIMMNRPIKQAPLIGLFAKIVEQKVNIKPPLVQ